MRQRLLILLSINGLVLYIFILLRIHYVSDEVHKQTRQIFPGKTPSSSSSSSSSKAKITTVVAQEKLNSLGKEEADLLDVRIGAAALSIQGDQKQQAEQVHPVNGDSFSSGSSDKLTKRDENIEHVNIRLMHVANKAGIDDPKLMGLEFKNDPHDGRPAYDAIVDASGNVIQDVSDLLQFAVVGFGKAGTTTIMDWISGHPKMQCFPEEALDLMKNKPGALLAKLYALPAGDYQRGYKSPLDVTMPHITQQLAKYFPKTKLIVGLRHPIRWFESLYNFRVQNWNLEYRKEPFPPPHEMIGSCRASTHNTCTAKGEFGAFLRNLGVTLTASASKDSQPDTVNEETLKHVHFEKAMYQAAKMKYLKVEPMPNPVFLFEISQLHEHNETRQRAFQQDVSDFLGLHDNPLSLELPHSKPGRTWGDPVIQAQKDAAKIDICDNQYADIRRVLLRQSRTTAAWIRHILLPTGRVRVSSPEYFDQILDQWMVDPCGPHETTNTAGKKILEILGIDVETLTPPAAATR